ncbi:MAG: family 20 glycosylhydrolase [Lentisphaerae bacterium]|nr:family 20 glycosylhydrolase [Lentisphaerota bacterium]MCP4102768.1 family 20 glycosylhydrolase [Lentisphaerota bacterium]
MLRRCAAYLALILLFQGNLLWGSSDNNNFKITNIRSEQGEGANFDLSFFLNVDYSSTLSSWMLGYYIPRTFETVANGNVNPDLKMTILDVSSGKKANECKLVTAQERIDRPGTNLTAGYLTVLKAAEKYDLTPGHTYKVTMKNNNQWAPTNYSSMPQSFFMVIGNPADRNVKNITTTPKDYTIGGYVQDSIDREVSQHNQDNLAESNTNTTLADNYNLVPTPVKTEKLENSGEFIAGDKLNIHIPTDRRDLNLKGVAEQLQSYLASEKVGISSTIFENTYEQNTGPAIVLTKMEDGSIIDNNPEGYSLTVDRNRIEIAALRPAGFFYGIQTLKVLLNNHLTNPQPIPALRIIDYPRFKYRGILLDVSRHYFSVATIQRLIDVMAAQKLNTLHIHFSDDEGWRLMLDNLSFLYKGAGRGIDQRSNLTPGMLIQGNLDITNYQSFDPSQSTLENYTKAQDYYYHYYTSRDIRKLIKYANNRQITIIPELDLPGHARALVYSYVKAFINPDDTSEYITVQGFTDGVIPVCLYNSSVAQGRLFTWIMNMIIEDTAALFNNQTTEYSINNEVSVGGDEVSAYAWTNDPAATGVWANKTALQKSQYFFQQLSNNLSGIVMSGWQQFVQEDDSSILPENAVPSEKTGHVWVWIPSDNGIEQAQMLVRQKYPIVLAFADNTYFDLAYTPDKWEPGFPWAGKFLDTNAALKSAANVTKTSDSIASDYVNYIKGIEGALWSENIPNERHLFYMALPKMCGLAEAAWAPQAVTVSTENSSSYQVNWLSLSKRLGLDQNGFLGYLSKSYNVKYRGYPNGIQKEVK